MISTDPKTNIEKMNPEGKYNNIRQSINNSRLNEATTSIRVKLRTKKMLSQLKTGNDSDDDVIRKLITKDLRLLTNEVQAIKYPRKTAFEQFGNIGIEFEYNDIIGLKAEDNYTFDLEISKVYTDSKIINSSVFFQISHDDLYKNQDYLEIYLNCILKILSKECKAQVSPLTQKKDRTIIISDKKDKLEIPFIEKNILAWKKVYVENNLSEESFHEDVARMLRKAKEFKENNQ